MTGWLAKIIVPLLTFVGVAALAASFNIGVPAILGLFQSDVSLGISAVLSIGGFIAAIIDYAIDGRWDGWIRW